jgi:hypothetical protein
MANPGQTPKPTNWLKVILVAVAVIVVVIITWNVVSAFTPEESDANSVSGSGSSTASDSGIEESAAPHANPDGFSGPIIEHCGARSDTTTVSKLNIDTGEVVDIASYPLPCWIIGRQSVDDITYYDSDTSETVDITNIVAPPSTSDFGTNEAPQFSNEQFDDQGLIVFFDGRAELFNFFDTKQKKVVHTARSYLPRYLQATVAHPDQEALAPTAPPDSPEFRTCEGLWLIDDSRYLRTNNVTGEYLQIASIPGVGDGENDCNSVAGQQVSPSGGSFSRAAADPTGSTIVFLVYSKTDSSALSMYRANLNNPADPTPVKITSGLLENAGAVARAEDSVIVNILGWK